MGNEWKPKEIPSAQVLMNTMQLKTRLGIEEKKLENNRHLV